MGRMSNLHAELQETADYADGRADARAGVWDPQARIGRALTAYELGHGDQVDESRRTHEP